VSEQPHPAELRGNAIQGWVRQLNDCKDELATSRSQVEQLSAEVERLRRKVDYWRGEAKWHMDLNVEFGKVIEQHHDVGEECLGCREAFVADRLQDVRDCQARLEEALQAGAGSGDAADVPQDAL
jgi:chromosome segregation ATPase